MGASVSMEDKLFSLGEHDMEISTWRWDVHSATAPSFTGDKWEGFADSPATIAHRVRVGLEELDDLIWAMQNIPIEDYAAERLVDWASMNVSVALYKTKSRKYYRKDNNKGPVNHHLEARCRKAHCRDLHDRDIISDILSQVTELFGHLSAGHLSDEHHIYLKTALEIALELWQERCHVHKRPQPLSCMFKRELPLPCPHSMAVHPVFPEHKRARLQ